MWETARRRGLAATPLGLVVFTVGCGSALDPAADREAWLRALGEPPAEAARTCRSIAQSGLRGECLVGVASAAATSGDQATASAVCGVMDAGLWKDECGFAVADALQLRGEAALEACEAAGRYREHCRGHVLTAAVARMDDLPLEVGQEQELQQAIRSRVLDSGVRLPRQHLSTVVFTGTARHIAARSREGVFHKAQCGAAPLPLCVRAYQETMREGMDRIDRAAICTGDLSSEGVEAAGGTPFARDARGVAERAWEALCVAWRGQAPGAGPRR